MPLGAIQSGRLTRRKRFGTATPRRQFLFGRLQALVNDLVSTGSVKRIYLFGSFVSGKSSPNDIDLFIVMEAGLTTAQLSGDVTIVAIGAHELYNPFRTHAVDTVGTL